MSAVTQGVGVPGEFGDGVAEFRPGTESDAALPAATRGHEPADDDWGSVLALACLIVGLTVIALLLGGT